MAYGQRSLSANELRRLLESLGPDEQIPSNELAQIYHPQQGGFIRREDTGETLFVNGQPGGISEQPIDQGYQQGMPSGMPQQAMQPTQRIKVAGYGNGIMSDVGEMEGPAPQLDMSRSAVDTPKGRGYYGKDGAVYVKAPDGSLTKVILGYDRDASWQSMQRDFLKRKGEAEIQETQARTQQIGAPNYQLTPEGDVFNPKTGQIETRSAQPGAVNRQRRNAEYSSGLKQVEKDDAQVAASSDLLADLARWRELNAKTVTGPIMGNRPISFDNDYQELKRLENKLATSNFKPGQGQISNFERGLIKGAGPMTTNDAETNNNIISIMEGGVQNMRDRANFREQYLQARGNLLGADRAWQEYLDTNPRFVRDDKGNIVPNEARTDWQGYFSGNAKAAQPANMPASSAEPATSGAPSIGEVRKGYRFLGGNPADQSRWIKVR